MSTLELYEEKNFKGNSVSLHNDVPDLSTVGFLKKASSMRITGDPWVVFTGKSYGGNFEVYKEGSYSSIPEYSDNISSVRVIRGGLYDPKITVYEHINYGGKIATITEPTRSLKAYDMDNMISSHHVLSGCWTLYENENYQGRKMVYVAGDKVPTYVPLCWNDVVSSLKPTDAYE